MKKFTWATIILYSVLLSGCFTRNNTDLDVRCDYTEMSSYDSSVFNNLIAIAIHEKLTQTQEERKKLIEHVCKMYIQYKLTKKENL